MVTDRIIKKMENGIIPWHQPWTGGKDVAVSHTTGKAYSFLNQLLLGEPGEYLTFNQCKAEGGNIKKGEKSNFVVFWTWLPKKGEEKPKKGEDLDISKCVPFLKYYHVFNVNQCEGIQPRFVKDNDTEQALDPISSAEDVIRLYFERETCTLNICNSSSAYYSPSEDKVVVPQMSQYKRVEEYYSTIFHEMTHSTGHKDRLNRFNDEKKASFGSDEYSREELVAEMGSAFILHRIGIDSEKAFNNSVGYLQAWLEHIKNDSKAVVIAAGKAEAAANLIIDGVKPARFNN